MNIQVLSDLHLEFGKADLDFTGVDLVILAGDIHTGEKGFEWIEQHIRATPVIYVLGNHEYYRSSYPKLLHKLRQQAAGTNIHVLEKESVEMDGIRFHGTTLWTNFELFGDPKIVGPICQQALNDYRLIRLDPSYSKLRSINTHVFHYQAVRWLRESLLSSNAKTNIVITHHAPSPRSIPERYRNDIVSAAYASDLEDLIRETRPDVWIHGHVHEPFDYFVDRTRIICNPRGYVDEPYNGFDKKQVLQLKRKTE